MTTFTVKGFSRALDNFAQIADTKLPKDALDKAAEKSIAVMVAASAASGGLKAKTFAVKGPNARKGWATAALVGWGFAVLDEYGSYKKPKGYEIEPKYGIGRGIYGKNRAILGNKRSGFAAAYVIKHPPQKAHPYVNTATPAIWGIVERQTDIETLKALAKVGLG